MFENKYLVDGPNIVNVLESVEFFLCGLTSDWLQMIIGPPAEKILTHEIQYYHEGLFLSKRRQIFQ
jgi:hypothetical protein